MKDELTGLLNRDAFKLLVEHELRVARRIQRVDALLVIDVDDLESVNASFGRDEGDETLRAVGRLLRGTARDSDVIGRIGGDEFAIFALDCAGSALATRIASAVAGAAQNAIEATTRELSVGMSIGITEVRCDEEFEALIERAGSAIFHTARTRRGAAPAA